VLTLCQMSSHSSLRRTDIENRRYIELSHRSYCLTSYVFETFYSKPRFLASPSNTKSVCFTFTSRSCHAQRGQRITSKDSSHSYWKIIMLKYIFLKLSKTLYNWIYIQCIFFYEKIEKKNFFTLDSCNINIININQTAKSFKIFVI